MKKCKKFSYIILFFFFFFFSSSFAVAKEVENTCQYKTTSDGNSVEIACEFYSDLSQPKCYISTLTTDENQETLINWGKVFNGDGNGEAGNWYKENKKCIPYIVFVDKKSLANSYELTGHGTKEAANIRMADQKKFYDNVTIATWNQLIVTVDDEIKGYINMLNNIGENYELDDFCDIKNGKYYVNANSYTSDLCRKSLKNLYNDIDTWDKNIKKWISENKISSDASIIKQYEQARKKAREQINEYWDEGEIENPSDEPITNPPDNSGKDPEYNSSSGKCVSCGDATLTNIPEQLPMFIRNIINVVQSIVPIILIGFGIYDFIKAVIGNDEKVMKESQNRFIRRIIAGVLVFLVVAIVKFGFGLFPGDTALSCVACFVTDSSSCSESYICNNIDFDIEMNTDAPSSNSSSTVNCDVYASRSECGRPEAKNKGCGWDSTANKCVLKNGNSTNATNNITTNCDAYASRSECGRPEAKNKGCSWDSTTNKCILKNSNNNTNSSVSGNTHGGTGASR